MLYFGLPTAIGLVGLYIVLPALHRAGVPLLWNYTLSFAGMFPLLLGTALVAYRLEGNKFTWKDIKIRFRIKGLTKSGWAWTIGLLIIFVGGQILLMPTAGWLVSILPLPLPEALPNAIDPRVVKTNIPSEFLGNPLPGNWGIALWYTVILLFNIIAEEFYWRGYVLPRQEVVHGRSTWIVHGVLWTLFHTPMWWNLLSLLPSTLSLSFVATRQKNTTPGIIVHLIHNGLGFIMLLLGILGLGN